MDLVVPSAPLAQVPREGSARGHHVLLRADSLSLVLPQREVGEARTLETPPRPTAEPGLFGYGEGDAVCAVVALSAGLRPLTVFPSDRFVLVRLTIGRGEMWFAWSEVRVLIDTELKRLALPPALRLPDSPITGTSTFDGRLLMHTDAGRLVDYAFAARS